MCFASGLAGGFALARVSRRKPATAAPIVIGSPRFVNGKDAFAAYAPESTAPKPGGPLYRIVSASGQVLTETTDPVAVMQSWRTLKHSARAESWQFMQDALIRDTMERTH